MKARKAAFFVTLIAATILALASFASAAPFSSVFVYGDSLSDL